MITSVPVFLRAFEAVFWDFDGVLKESVGVKTEAYVRLFQPFGEDVAARVREHHERNGGMSRYEKLPLYLGWAGMPSPIDQVTRYSELFSRHVKQAVIDSAWVPGAREYLHEHCMRQHFVLITATPQSEIEDILLATGIGRCFREVHGAPTAKEAAVGAVLARLRCDPAQALVVGDSQTEWAAAERHGASFLLRRTPQNDDLQRRYEGPQCEDFTHE